MDDNFYNIDSRNPEAESGKIISLRDWQLKRLIQQTVSETLACMNLENSTPSIADMSEQEKTDMSKRIRAHVELGDKNIWLSGESQQDLFNAYLKHAIDAGIVVVPSCASKPEKPKDDGPLFGPYLRKYVDTYKRKQTGNTLINRERIIRTHIIPKIGKMPIRSITTAFIQTWFDELCEKGLARETLLKIKNVASPAFDGAVCDGLIAYNPFKDKRFVINTNKGKHHKAIPHEKMEGVKAQLDDLPDTERRLMALLCYTGMRIEEVLGLRWQDVDAKGKVLHVTQAVIHPTRNKPEVKAPKTKSSARSIPMPDRLIALISPVQSEGYLVGGKEPLTYTVFNKMFKRLRTQFDLLDYSAHDFRDTCATEWRESGMSLDVISRLLGHADTSVTEKCYVKFREKSLDGARDLMNRMSGQIATEIASESA